MTRQKAALFLLLSICGLLPAGKAAGPSVLLRAEANPKRITIGDHIRYEFTVVFSSDLAAAPLALPEPLGTFEVLDHRSEPPRQGADGRISVTHRLVLTSFSTGTQTIPAIGHAFLTADGQSAEARTEPIDITVRSLLEELGDEGSLRPVKGFFIVPTRRWVWVLLAVLALGALIWIITARRRRNTAGAAAGPAIPPEETAWDALHRLENSDLLSSGRIKAFYFDLSLILRWYVEERHAVPALDRTTAEVMSEARARHLDAPLLANLREFLDNADLVKFARHTPTETDIDADIARVRAFLNASAPAPDAGHPRKQEEEAIPV